MERRGKKSSFSWSAKMGGRNRNSARPRKTEGGGRIQSRTQKKPNTPVWGSQRTTGKSERGGHKVRKKQGRGMHVFILTAPGKKTRHSAEGPAARRGQALITQKIGHDRIMKEFPPGKGRRDLGSKTGVTLFKTVKGYRHQK